MEAKYLESIVNQLQCGDSDVFGRLVFDGYKANMYDEFLIQHIRVAIERKCHVHRRTALNTENLYIITIVKKGTVDTNSCSDNKISAFIKIRRGELDMSKMGMTSNEKFQKRRVGDGYKKIFYGHSCWHYDFLHSPHNKLFGSL